MVSYDVKPFFTLVSFFISHYYIIIKYIYEKHAITTAFTKHETKLPLTICTNNVHFSFNNDI